MKFELCCKFGRIFDFLGCGFEGLGWFRVWWVGWLFGWVGWWWVRICCWGRWGFGWSRIWKDLEGGGVFWEGRGNFFWGLVLMGYIGDVFVIFYEFFNCIMIFDCNWLKFGGEEVFFWLWCGVYWCMRLVLENLYLWIVEVFFGCFEGFMFYGMLCFVDE